MTKKGQWIPSNRTTVRICVVLLYAYRDGAIKLSYPDFYAVCEGTFKSRFNWSHRVCLGRLWRTHGGLELARRIDQFDRLPVDVVEELQMSA